MNINRFSILTIIFGGLCTISLPFYVLNKLDSNYVILMIGLTQFFSGLSERKTSESLNLKEGYNGSKIIGSVTLIVGIFFIITAIIRILS